MHEILIGAQVMCGRPWSMPRMFKVCIPRKAEEAINRETQPSSLF